jgi:nitrate reductase gamma subunit
MSIFKGRRKFGMLLLAIWLVATGLADLIHLNFMFMGTILGALAIAAGVLLLIDR